MKGKEKMNTQDNKVYNELGSLLLFNKASKEDMDLLMTLLCRGSSEYLALLRGVVKDDFNLIKLFDVMAGQKVQFPERKKIYKMLEKTFIYNYCKKHNFSDSSYVIMAKEYGKRIPQTRAIVNTMQKFLDSNTNKGFEDEEFECEDIEEEEDARLESKQESESIMDNK